MRKIISLAAVAALALLLPACASMPQWLRPPQSFQVTVYQPLAKPFSFRETKSGTESTVNYQLQLAEVIEENYSADRGYAFVIEPTGGTPDQAPGLEPTPTTEFKVTLSNGGKVVRVFYVERFSQEYGSTYLQVPGWRYCVIASGDVTIESTITGQEPVSQPPGCLLQPK